MQTALGLELALLIMMLSNRVYLTHLIEITVLITSLTRDYDYASDPDI